eukprot:1143293-Pelagomonas_calceolata.AAC.3
MFSNKEPHGSLRTEFPRSKKAASAQVQDKPPFFQDILPKGDFYRELSIYLLNKKVTARLACKHSNTGPRTGHTAVLPAARYRAASWDTMLLLTLSQELAHTQKGLIILIGLQDKAACDGGHKASFFDGGHLQHACLHDSIT